MKRVLFLAYHFPPIGGAGVQRSVGFVRYLREFGYEPLVVTGRGPGGGHWTPADDSLLQELPPRTEIRKLAAPQPPTSDGWRGRAELWLGARDPFVAWWTNGVLEAGGTEDVDVIYASMSPFESGVVAARLAALLGRPWVADLRDPWALDEMQAYPTRIHRRRLVRQMRSVLSSASAVIMNTLEAARELSAFPELARTPVVTITNGFDPSDFSGAVPQRDDDAFRIVHTGFFHTDPGGSAPARAARRVLGGSVPGVDRGTRSHVYLMRALESVRAADPPGGERIELHLAGVLSEVDRSAAGAGSSLIREHGYLPHAETTALMRSADLLFLPMHDLPEGQRSRIVPGKTYEYLAAGPPILAAVPDGDARDILAGMESTHLCRPRAVDCMARAVLAELQRGEPVAVRPSSALAPYERRTLTRRLAGVFDLVTDADAAAPALTGGAARRVASGSA